VVICSVFIVATLISADWVKQVFDKIFKFFIDNFGWSYLLIVAGFVLFCFIKEKHLDIVMNTGLQPFGRP
jgi:glycine betaine transporter